MVRVLGIDASTTATGIVIIDDVSLLHLSVETFKGCNTFWEKCDAFQKHLKFIRDQEPNINAFFIEEPMKRFAEGFSSAGVISTLQRFNGIVCYITRQTFGVDPTYINVSSARKAAGIKVVPKDKAGGRNAKQQTFDHVMATELSHIEWPKKQRSENIVDWAKDIVDAYVVARGGLLLNNSFK
jgi:hypothetical protein